MVYSNVIGALGEGVVRDIIRILVAKIQSEIANNAKAGTSNQLMTNRCWNIMKQMCDIRHFVPVYLQTMEKELLPLFEYLKMPEKIDFNEEIVLVVTSFIRAIKNTTPAMEEMLPYWCNVYKSNGNTIGHLMLCFNLYLVHGGTMFKNKP